MSIIERLASFDHAITVAELGELLNVGKTAIYDMVRRGSIPCIRIGYSVRFDPEAVATWLRARSSKGALPNDESSRK
jgi:excisionase family DNA binding protein